MTHTGAEFSPCRRYRYRLWRVWDTSLPRVVFCLLNPSKADEIDNDPTIERQERRVLQWCKTGYLHAGGIEVVNLYAIIETYSHRLVNLHKQGVDLVGPDNDRMIVAAAKDAAITICGWGNLGLLDARGTHVINLLHDSGVTPHALKINVDGTPTHPLYLGYALRPMPVGRHGLLQEPGEERQG